MCVDLHIHSNSSDGKMTIEEIFREASRRGIKVISVTDHDSIDCQEYAVPLSEKYGIKYIHGLELNVSFSHPDYNDSKAVSLDFLAYQYDIHYRPLIDKLQKLKEYRKKRAESILEKINMEFRKEGIPEFTSIDMKEIEDSVDGTFGRPHIADYLVKKGIVASRQRAFDRYLVKCNVPKMPLSLEEASQLVKGAGGKLIIAHPNNPRGTSLVSLTEDIDIQHQIIKETMLKYIDGVECWHSSHDKKTVDSYLSFAKGQGIMVTGGSDCHQQPIIMGSVKVPLYVVEQFGIKLDKVC
ncbi:MAG: PHP domain-containing protein [Deltaproteobacteria bacterium]|nr:PHP domain-containing protein [Deltaproteobacteria bacterium]